jgi:succinate dehydrogenase/fumarate reductase flavoprotein subunit
MNGKRTGLSRRGFLAGAGTLAAAGAFGLGLSGCSPDATGSPKGDGVSVDYVTSVEWATEYDVVIIGWGGAGSVAAITAADAGAKVLLVEKAPYGDEGGNTRYCEQYVATPTSYEGGVAFMNAFAHGFDTATEEIVDFMVKGSMDNVDWLLSMGAKSFGYPTADASTGADLQVEYPPLEELETWVVERDGRLMLVGEWPIMPNGQPNSDVAAYQVEAPDSGQKKYWKLMRKNVVERAGNIHVWYESPATKLIQDPLSKTVLGVKVSRKGQDLNVRAKNGVILTCGSYEASQEMYETYAQWSLAYPLGSTYNTGDGIRMALGVGADLWHMAALSGPWISPKYEGEDRGIFGGVMTQRIAITPSCIYVGGNAKRFMKESDWHKHGHVNVGGTWVSQIVPEITYAIMDSDARYGPGVIRVTPESEIISANSIDELAQKIDLDAATLTATVDEWNADCANGVDTQFHRPTVALKELSSSGPYFAVRLYPCCVNCQGGPVRNIKCEVLNVEGDPIPHLYSAGELGSFWAGVYQGGGNIAETMYTGREAGKNAAENKPDVEPTPVVPVASSLAALGNDLDESEKAVEVTLGENEYLGVGEGLHGEIKAKVTVESGRVTNVEIVEQHETEGMTDEVWTTMREAIIASGGTDVDTISGATLASRGLIASVNDALTQAG